SRSPFELYYDEINFSRIFLLCLNKILKGNIYTSTVYKNYRRKKMNKLLTTLASVLLISVLTACGNSDNDNANDTIDDSTSNNVEQNDSMDNNDTSNEMADDNNDNTNMEDNNNHKEHEDAVEDNDDATEKMKELNIEEI